MRNTRPQPTIFPPIYHHANHPNSSKCNFSLICCQGTLSLHVPSPTPISLKIPIHILSLIPGSLRYRQFPELLFLLDYIYIIICMLCTYLIAIEAAVTAKSLQSCSTLCDPIDGSLPGSPAHGIFQARTLECVAISFSNA